MLIAILGSMIYAVPISIICAVHLFPLFCPEEATVAPWIISFAFLAVCALFRHGSLKVRLIIIAAIVALSTGLLFAVELGENAEFFSERLYIALILAIAIATYIAGELLSAFRPLRIIVSALAFGAIIYMLIIGNDPGVMTSVMLLMVILVTIMREVQQLWKKEGDTDTRRHMVSILPFIILIALFVTVSPSSEEPYDWPIAHRIWQFAKDTATKISQFFSEGDGLEHVIGFSFENPSLASNLSEGDLTNLFTVSFSRKNTPSLNLGACAYNEFDGRTWSNSVGSGMISRRHPFDNIETLGYLNTKGADAVSDHTRYYNVSVTYSKLHTRFALLTTKYKDAYVQGKLVDTISDRDETIFKNGPEGFGTYYTFVAAALNKRHKEFIEFMKDTGKPLSEEDWIHSVSDICQLSRPDYPYEDYLSYIKDIKKNYCREVDISPELRAKLDELYEGCSSSYEKMIRLEALLSNMTYTTDPGPFPEDIDSAEDFVHWFMLRNPRGYCNYFATVMVLLARAEGLPARLVEGFHVSPTSSGGSEVTNRDAHSWAEIYFEGFGFVPFDPTPGISTDSVWQTTSERLDYLSSLSKGSLEAFTTGWEVDENTLLPLEPEPEGNSLALILIPTLMCAILFPAVILLYRVIMRRRFAGLPLSEKAVSLCHSNMRLLRFLGAKPAPGETLHEFAERIKEDLADGLVDFLFLYEVISYSDKTTDDEMLLALMRSNRDLSAYASAKRRIAYFFYSLFTM